MTVALLYFLSTVILSGIALILFFFVTTRGSLLIANKFQKRNGEEHIYWLYKNPLLVWLTDRQFIVSAVLLLQYEKLVAAVLSHFKCIRFNTHHVVQIAAVSGNLTEKVAHALPRNISFFVLDHETAGLVNTEIKLDRAHIYGPKYLQGDAAHVPMADESCDISFSFFLFHELPLRMKYQVLGESLRVLRPGGIFVFAEFHRPENIFLRAYGSFVFGLFEPHAKEMWRWDPVQVVDQTKYTTEKSLYFFGYFQVVRIKKL